MELIITEKNNAARRIAEILSDGGARTERVGAVNVYAWGGKRCIGLSGHVVGVDFPQEYNDWRDVEPAELVDAEIVKTPTKEDIVTALKRLAKQADEVVIATDYDREGELIGKEAYELVHEANEGVPTKRVRFSSITENEVKKAFADPDDLDFDLAAAGEARQIIDLIWGAALTRFLSLSARQMGDDFISVGRVQTPTLKLIVDKEREIEAFDPDDYWELFADLAKNGDEFEAQYFYLDEDGNEAERVWEEDDAEEAFATLREAAEAVVESVSRRTRTDDPPAPFNTTQFIRAAGSLGYSAGRAMSIAEDLYTAGYITYPRTDNTVYPEDLDPEELLTELSNSSQFYSDATSLLEQEELTPTEGEEETTDHPPIHPTPDLPDPDDLSEDEWEVYELVVRRFFATLAEPAVWEHLKVVAAAEGLQLKANGKRLVEEGYHAVYPYFGTSENYVPDVTEGEALEIGDVELEEKQTQPPRRYGQSRLIETMEDMGIGTKCLTGDTKVLVREGEDVIRRPIGDLFAEGDVVLADGDTDIATVPDGPTTISFDETLGRTTDREQTLVSERPLESDERVYEVTTSAGTFSATSEHPVYLLEDGDVTVKPLAELSEGDNLLASRPSPSPVADTFDVIASWDEFANACDQSSKLYGTGCSDSLAKARADAGDSQQAFADRLGAHRTAITRYENDDKDVPIWILDKLGIRPDAIHGLNDDSTFDNPFPVRWSPALARLLGNTLGDGSIHHSQEGNTIDIRYHNTDRRLIDRFVSDVEDVFGIKPGISARPGQEEHHLQKYQVQLPSALGRIVKYLLDTVTEDGCPAVPPDLQPAFVGALFDDEGQISTDGKAFISNTDHDLLRGVAEMLADHGVETRLSETQHKLYIRGRRNLERFLERIPISADEKFYRGVDRLHQYNVTKRKARLLELLSKEQHTTDELADELDISRNVVHNTIRELKDDGLVETHIEGSNRSHDGNRVSRYSTDQFENSVYAVLCGCPTTSTVESITEREYNGPVYDLTIDETAPNFAVEGGVIVHNSTRHHTIEKLYDRGYIESDPPRPTRLARAVVAAAEEFADLVVSEEMTSELEADMTAIANGEKTLDEVTEESREMLDRIFDELAESREEIGEHLQDSLKADKTLGPCPECGADLLVRRSRRGSFFVGCDGYPDCTFTLPLPSTGEPLVLEATCEDHDLHEVKMLAGRSTFVHGCPLCKAEEAEAEEDTIIGECPECGEEHGGKLAIKRLQNGSRLVGCTRYPDCDYSLPLPRRGEIEVTDEYCEEHDLPELVVHDGDDDSEPWELGCPICNYKEYQERQRPDELEALDGVGPKTKERLEEAGVSSIDELADADAEELAATVEGVSADKVREWQAKAD